MGQFPQTPSSHPYPLSLQLKLYQAFIFSVPILFTIILFLLFYLFYLKRRGSSTISPPQHMNSRSFNGATTIVSMMPFEKGLKKELREKLPVVLFDEDLKARDTVCSVCLGDFEKREKLHQIPTCKHMFHLDCIHHWLMSNPTCPLCRASIVPTKIDASPTTARSETIPPTDAESNDHITVNVLEQATVNEQTTVAIGPTDQPCLTESRNQQPQEVHYLHGNSIAEQIPMNDI